MKMLMWLVLFLSVVKHADSEKAANCSHLKELERTVKDGDYILYPPALGSQWVKIYCHNMKSSPSEYLSLHYLNGGNYPDTRDKHCTGDVWKAPKAATPGTTTYTKIRVDIETMIVNTADYLFAEVTGFPIPYGTAADCYSEQYSRKPNCSVRGYFVIDLRDTGFIIDPRVSWDVHGYKAFMDRHNVTYEGQKHDLRCGGYCGSCSNSKPLKLKRSIVDGNWGSWTAVKSEDCSVTCETGRTQVFYKRKCDNPKPKHTGKSCVGLSMKSKIETCFLPICPVDGGWSEWKKLDYVGQCTVTCGLGIKRKYYKRTCNNPVPRGAGLKCPGSHVISVAEICDTNITCSDHLPVNGGWGQWTNTSFSSCSTSCETGVITIFQTRDCDSPTPALGGRPCRGRRNQTTVDVCNQHIPCAVNGQWSTWYRLVVGQCVNCVRIVTLGRNCTNPVPVGSGLPCSGYYSSETTESCNCNATYEEELLVGTVKEERSYDSGLLLFGSVTILFFLVLLGAIVHRFRFNGDVYKTVFFKLAVLNNHKDVKKQTTKKQIVDTSEPC